MWSVVMGTEVNASPFVGHHANAVKRTAVDEFHGDFLGAFKAVGLEVLGQHGPAEVHGQHHVDALAGHVLDGGGRLRPEQRHAQRRKSQGAESPGTSNQAQMPQSRRVQEGASALCRDEGDHHIPCVA